MSKSPVLCWKQTNRPRLAKWSSKPTIPIGDGLFSTKLRVTPKLPLNASEYTQEINATSGYSLDVSWYCTLQYRDQMWHLGLRYMFST